jgi:hypothetical protein
MPKGACGWGAVYEWRLLRARLDARWTNLGLELGCGTHCDWCARRFIRRFTEDGMPRKSCTHNHFRQVSYLPTGGYRSAMQQRLLCPSGLAVPQHIRRSSQGLPG